MKVCLPLVAAALLAACSGSTSSILEEGGAKDTGTKAHPGPVSIQIGNCTPLVPCGGNVVGTWAFHGGCVDDPLGTAKSLCSTLLVHSETASASGTVTFTANHITRSYDATYAMDIVVPTACLLGEACTQIQTQLSAYIPNATCQSASEGCECTGSLDSSATQQAAYTIANDEVVTGSDEYAYCVTGGALQYRHVAGPSPEMGTYDLMMQ